MKQYICDKCGDTSETRDSYLSPTGWSQVRCEGYISFKVGSIKFSVDLCEKCVQSIAQKQEESDVEAALKDLILKSIPLVSP
jgi:hypothetical protein